MKRDIATKAYRVAGMQPYLVTAINSFNQKIQQSQIKPSFDTDSILELGHMKKRPFTVT